MTSASAKVKQRVRTRRGNHLGKPEAGGKAENGINILAVLDSMARKAGASSQPFSCWSCVWNEHYRLHTVQSCERIASRHCRPAGSLADSEACRHRCKAALANGIGRTNCPRNSSVELWKLLVGTVLIRTRVLEADLALFF